MHIQIPPPVRPRPTAPPPPLEFTKLLPVVKSTQDKATGDVYYVNTWNQEIRWAKPLEMSLFEDKGKDARPGTPGASTGSGADADTFDDGVGSIGSRFAQLYGKLADKATQAAEEEAGMMRYVEATTQGGDMLAAASEWTFVSTDSRLSRAKCWYRARTSEYFWGKTPPLVSSAQAPTSAARAKDNDGNAGDSAGVGGKGGGGVDPGQAVSFADRAAGETWLKTQDIPSLLEMSEVVCGIGPVGWRQLRATPLPDKDLASELTVSAEDTNSIPASITASNSPAGKKLDAPGDGDSVGQDGILHQQQQLGASAPTDVASATSVASTASVPSLSVPSMSVPSASVPSVPRVSSSVPSFTFFHHAEMGQVRWCLSPRSALATPRTPRREVSLSRLATHNNDEEEGDGDNEENLRNSEAALGAGGTSWEDHSGVTGGTSRDNHSEENEWEVVEDGDMIFYYNRVSGTSTWDPPPGWEQSG